MFSTSSIIDNLEQEEGIEYKKLCRLLKISKKSPKNPNKRAVPASVKATGKPKSNNPNVVKNITIAKISGLIIFSHQTLDDL